MEENAPNGGFHPQKMNVSASKRDRMWREFHFFFQKMYFGKILY